MNLEMELQYPKKYLIKFKYFFILKGFLLFIQYNIYREIIRKDYMDKIKFYLEKYRLYIIIFLTSIFIMCILLFILFYNKENVIAEEIVMEEKRASLTDENIICSESKNQNNVKKIKVDVKGYVQKTGVYELDSNSRVIDAINKAGGLKKEANTDYINLSKKLVDEMIIIVYSNDDVSKFKEEEKQIIYIEYKCECPDNINDSCITNNDIVNTNGVEGTKTESKDGINNLVSINTGTKEELMTLPGIGESKANNIIKYREEKGEFKNLEDIKNVSGIGESAYSKIKDYIKL